jgi:hypothetical protein
MILSNKDRQARYRAGARIAKEKLPGLVSVVGDAIRMTQEAINIERQRGTRPNDGTAAGEMMAKMEAWVFENQNSLDQLEKEIGSFYVPRETAP